MNDEQRLREATQYVMGLQAGADLTLDAIMGKQPGEVEEVGGELNDLYQGPRPPELVEWVERIKARNAKVDGPEIAVMAKLLQDRIRQAGNN